MEWLSQNWVWVLFFAAFIAMHLFGHGGHGGHGHGRRVDPNEPKPNKNGGVQNNSGQSSGHQH